MGSLGGSFGADCYVSGFGVLYLVMLRIGYEGHDGHEWCRIWSNFVLPRI